jgi:hypothetical protein
MRAGDRVKLREYGGYRDGAGNWTVFVPKAEAKEVYVVHTTLGHVCREFDTFREAFKVFKIAIKRGHGSVGLWRGPRWEKLFEDGEYPEFLTKPYDSHK